MYGIFTYIWLIFMVNVGKYTIHGSYGKGIHLNHWTRMIVGEAEEFLPEPPAKDTCRQATGAPCNCKCEMGSTEPYLTPVVLRIHPGDHLRFNNLQQLLRGPSLWYYILYEISLYRCVF